MEKFCEKNKNFFWKVNDDFLDAIHEHSPVLVKDTSSTINSKKFRNKYLHQRVLSACSYCNPHFPKRRVFFPGPLASSMSVLKIPLVQNNDYFITEKSDGIRVMMFSLFVDTFPKWIDKTAMREFGLFECLFIEGAVNKMTGDGTFGKIKNVKIREIKMELIMRRELNSKTNKFRKRFFIKRFGQKVENPIAVKRGRFMTYIFDRTCKFYLCLEELKFPQLSWKKQLQNNPKISLIPQKEVLLDGEIVFNLHEKRWNYSIYDVVVYHDNGGLISCNQMDMSEKIPIMKINIVDMHHFYHRRYAKSMIYSLQLIPKHFYIKHEIKRVFGLIKRENEQYIYKGYNKNDGLIFTPNSNAMYNFSPGPCKALLKWKWSDKLTVDFQLKKLSKENDEDPVSYGLYYKRCNQLPNIEFFKEIRKIRAVNEKIVKTIQRTLVDTSKRIVVECFFKSERNQVDDTNNRENEYNTYWEITHLRLDKVKPNTYLTSVSVLTAMVENLSQNELSKSILDVTQIQSIDELFLNYFQRKSKTRAISFDDDDFEEDKNENLDEYVHLHLGFYKDKVNTPILKVYHNESMDYTSFNLVKFCVFKNIEGDDLVNEMKKKFIHIFHQDESKLPVFRTMFLPSRGLWKLIDLKGDISRCFAPEILDQLEKMVSICKSIREEVKRKKEKRKNVKRKREFDFIKVTENNKRQKTE